MANVKISELTQLTNPVSSDVLPIVDSAVNTTKKISIADLLKNASAGSAAAPGIAFDDDSNTGIYSPGADQLAISTGGTRRMQITSTGDIAFGNFSDPQGRIDLRDGKGVGTAWISRVSSPEAGANRGFRQVIDGSEFLAIYHDNSAAVFEASGSERLRITSTGTVNIKGAGTAGVTQAVSFNGSAPVNSLVVDSSGRLLVGTSSARSGIGSRIQLEGAGGGAAEELSLVYNGENTVGPRIDLVKTRGAAVGANTAVINNDELGLIRFYGADGTSITANNGASIGAYVDGEPFTSGDTTDLPTRLVFSTTADGASSPTRRVTITSGQAVIFGDSSDTSPASSNLANVAAITSGRGRFSVDGGEVLDVNRRASDGDLVWFRQDGAVEGTISVSGTTVSYNGAHLSRWSQLPGGVERIGILRGTVLSNIDEMCEWGEEENEQLNRMKVSDVEGDKNVSGVFQAWDDDDDTYTNDFYCAMTGDFIIRISAGVTVERGDLLMSAGDGTAKPQDDDIIRSKTIAKVTSTNVSCTYPDGSYCVPCVLMAC